MILTYHMWWVCISNWNDIVENMGLAYFTVFIMGLGSLTVILNPYWTYKKTQQLLNPVDWNFSNAAVKNGSFGKLNSETDQKKKT